MHVCMCRCMYVYVKRERTPFSLWGLKLMRLMAILPMWFGHVCTMPIFWHHLLKYVLARIHVELCGNTC